MKRAIFFLMAAALAFAAAGRLQAAELGKEILSRPWGAPISDFKGLAGVGTEGKVSYFIDPKRAYRLFDTDVSELVYGFYEQKFFAVYANIEAIDAYSRIKRQLRLKFGLPKIGMEARGGLTTHSWKTGETRIKLKYAEPSGAMKLAVYYMPIAGKVNLELQRELDAEPPEPLFPLSQTRQKEAVELMELFGK